MVENPNEGSPPKMKAPNLFVLGAQKAGTTYLARALANHPDVYFTDPKETMFFSQRKVRTRADYENYLKKYFSGAGDETWRGEGSTTYLQWPRVRESFRRFVPNAPRMIVCLRHPVSKAVSFFIHNWRRGRYAPGATLQDANGLGIELSPYLTSLYADSIAGWMKAYPNDRFLFLKFDDLVRDPRAFVRQATDFLGIAPMKSVPSGQINAGLPLDFDGENLTVRKSDNLPAADLPRFSMQELSDLQERFKADLERTEQLTGLDLKSWYDLPEFAS